MAAGWKLRPLQYVPNIKATNQRRTAIITKTLNERHDEAALIDQAAPPCKTESDLRQAAEDGAPEDLLALATALVNNTIEHQDPDEALCWLEKARVAVAPTDEPFLERVLEVERQAKKKQEELEIALEMEYTRSVDA
ncbi:hypothetical protein [Methylophaga sp.]|uniref:hypothetical protein n=1 Tax=Methylophaga sp. TaxID=2024840 RepID=UPI0013FE85ED|nr:hypothetical protein [Methylophaga sp.]MTI63515.1 S46 family peptidase [Methylophaga sp.]